MADVYSCVYSDSDWWDGTESWGGEADQSARDSKYSTRTFSTLSAWEADRDGNSSSGDTEHAIIIGPWTSADTAQVGLVGFNADDVVINCPITLNDDQDNPARHDGILDNKANAYSLAVDGSCFYTADIGFTLDGVQIKRTGGSGYAVGIPFYDGALSGTIQNCIIYTAASNECIRLGLSSGDSITMINSILIVDNNSSPEAFDGHTSGTTKIINCTIDSGGSPNGLLDPETVKNCAVFNTGDDFVGTFTASYCASDDGDGTDAVDWDSGATDWAANFDDYANHDYTPLDQDLPDAGIGPSSDSDVPTTDIIGNTRSGTTCTIGAFEYQAAGGGDALPMAANLYRMRRAS